MPAVARRGWLVIALTSTACPDGGAGEGTTTAATASSTSGDPSVSTTSTTTPVDVDSGTTTAASTTAASTTEPGTTTGEPVMPTVLFPRTSILPEELAVIVNDDDPLSSQIADYYVAARAIPAANVVHVSLPLVPELTPEQFEPILADVQAELPDGIQALALTFTNPYRVGCMSITSAFTFGYGPCGGCIVTNASPYYDSLSLRPFDDHGVRPTMMLAATSLENAQALVDRGVASDGTHPAGTGYLVRTTDPARSVRWRQMQAASGSWEGWDGLELLFIDNAAGGGSDTVQAADDVVFYFTGLADVPGIETNTYHPGAIADHLTSFGGQVPQSGQMSALRWLEVGATGSYGTVVEPCNYPEKFPHVGVAIANYFRGQTLVEAYWKSVAWPGEGLFIGEPLARPWDGSMVEMVGDDLVITTNLLVPGVLYDIDAADALDGPWDNVLTGMIPSTQTFEITLPDAERAYYRLQPQP
jgi:uncharacterized protein (TIGR03790 family)